MPIDLKIKIGELTSTNSVDPDGWIIYEPPAAIPGTTPYRITVGDFIAALGLAGGSSFTGDPNAIVFTDAMGDLATDNTALYFDGTELNLVDFITINLSEPIVNTPGALIGFAGTVQINMSETLGVGSPGSLIDATGNAVSIDWAARILYPDTGFARFNWQDGLIYDDQGIDNVRWNIDTGEFFDENASIYLSSAAGATKLGDEIGDYGSLASIDIDTVHGIISLYVDNLVDAAFELDLTTRGLELEDNDGSYLVINPAVGTYQFGDIYGVYRNCYLEFNDPAAQFNLYLDGANVIAYDLDNGTLCLNDGAGINAIELDSRRLYADAGVLIWQWESAVAQTGFSAYTGVQDKGDYDDSTITLPNLAKQVGALKAALYNLQLTTTV